MGTDSRGRAAARSTYDSVIGYVGLTGDKNAVFSASVLGKAGCHGYDRNGFHRLINGGIIKVVGRERSGRNNVYTLGEGMLAMGLYEILGLSYRSAMMRCNNK